MIGFANIKTFETIGRYSMMNPAIACLRWPKGLNFNLRENSIFFYKSYS